jgi:hypothetical protein
LDTVAAISALAPADIEDGGEIDIATEIGPPDPELLALPPQAEVLATMAASITSEKTRYFMIPSLRCEGAPFRNG